MTDESTRAWAEPLLPAVQAFDDAHESWHEAFEAYHDPPTLRRRVEHLIQSLRNITFRLQASKRDMPRFDDWYTELWVPFMANDRHMRWLRDARTEIVKKSGLSSASKASILVVHSYLEPPTAVREVSATTPTEQVVDEIRSDMPDDIREHAAIEVRRRWEVPELAGEDLLFVLAWCLHVLDSLLLYAQEAIENAGPLDELPSTFVSTVQWPPCASVPPSIVPVVYAADTGEQLDVRFEPAYPPPLNEALERYGLQPIQDISQDPIEWGRQLHHRARQVFKTDGTHIPLLFLRSPSGEWHQRVVLVKDRRDKYLLWHRIALEAAYKGYDAYIMITEVWMAQLNGIDSPHGYPPDLESVPGRIEALNTWIETAEGQISTWSSTIVRHLGKAYLKPPNLLEDSEAGFAAPLRRVWRERRGVGRAERFSRAAGAEPGRPSSS